MKPVQPKNPLHGVTLERMLVELVARYGWPALGEQVDIRCFQVDPSIASSLKFLRHTPWARQRVDAGAQLQVDLPAHQVRIESQQPAEIFAAALSDEGYAPA